MNKIVIIGYSGHAFVVNDIFKSSGRQVAGYCDHFQVKNNPHKLQYFGTEDSIAGLKELKANDWFISIGNNKIRKEIFEKLTRTYHLQNPVNAIHRATCIGSMVKIGCAVMVGPNVIVNVQSKIGNGVILNSGAIVEHECQIGNFAHIAPGAVLAGNVKVGEQSFIGANSVIKQGVSIGNNVTVGAGSVVIRNIPDGHTVAGNPTRIIRKL